MNRSLPALADPLAFALVLVLAVCWSSTGRAVAADNREGPARSAGEQWLALLDAGQYGPSWQAAASYFQGLVSEADWKKSVEGVRKPLGALVSRKFTKSRFTRSAPGAPDGEYVILEFETSFANKQHAVETVTPMLDRDGKWKVAGYFIR